MDPVKDDERSQADAQLEIRQEPSVEEPMETICGRHLRSIDDLNSFPKFKENERGSLLCKYLTEDVWNKYHDKKDKLGVTFKQCILSGCQNTDSGVGVYAASPDSYDSFYDLFNPIIEDYHKFNVNETHPSNMDYKQL